MPKPSIKQTASFQKAFDYYNKKLFANALPQVMLNFSRSGSSTVAFYAPKRWEQAPGKGKPLDEISLNPVHLGRTLEEIFSDLVHEMAHLWQHAFGTPSRPGYHNKEWAEKMIEVGLQPDDGTGKMTGQKMGDFVIKGGVFAKAFREMPSEFKLPWRVFVEGEARRSRREGRENEGGGNPLPSGKRLKYSCPECDTNIWGKGDLSIACIPCKTAFEPV